MLFRASHTDSDSLNPVLSIVGDVESVICILNISFFLFYSFIFISDKVFYFFPSYNKL